MLRVDVFRERGCEKTGFGHQLKLSAQFYDGRIAVILTRDATALHYSLFRTKHFGVIVLIVGHIIKKSNPLCRTNQVQGGNLPQVN